MAYTAEQQVLYENVPSNQQSVKHEFKVTFDSRKGAARSTTEKFNL
jgi:hypothetical protein